MTAHITQLKILHGVSLLCVCFVPGASPVNTVSHNQDTIKRTFKCFCRLFAQKSDDFPRSAPPCPQPPPRKSGLWQFPFTAPHFRRKQAPELPFSVTIPSRENGIAERPQTLRYPENQNNSSAEYAQSNAEGISNHFLYKKPAGHCCTAGFGLQFTLPWSRALPQPWLPALLRGQQRERRASPRASGDWGHPSAGRG